MTIFGQNKLMMRVLKELKRHRKLNHIEKVDFCWDFSTNSCEYGDENCWFVHEEPETLYVYKFSMSGKEFNPTPVYIRRQNLCLCVEKRFRN